VDRQVSSRGTGAAMDVSWTRARRLTHNATNLSTVTGSVRPNTWPSASRISCLEPSSSPAVECTISA